MVSHEEIAEIGGALEQMLPARAFVDEIAPGCAALYLLAGLHDPCGMEVRAAWRKGPLPHAQETYLRLLFSPLGRYYTLQEVRLSASVESDGLWFEEQRFAGVIDRRLALFVKGTQGLLRKRRLAGLDAVFLAEPVPDPDGHLAAQLGVEPTLWTLLFEPTPAGCTRAEWAL